MVDELYVFLDHQSRSSFPSDEVYYIRFSIILAVLITVFRHSLVDFSGQEAAMCKILDILVHYHPDNAIIFLALWYLDRLFPKALVMSRGLVEQDGVELMSRIFLLGLTLANKWLNDFKMPLKDWCVLSYSIFDQCHNIVYQESLLFSTSFINP